MKLRTIVFLNAAIVGLGFGGTFYYFGHQLWWSILGALLAFSLTFALLYYFFERYVQEKIKLIYKLIRSLKLGKDLKASLGDKLS